jgi:hypothetical protein
LQKALVTSLLCLGAWLASAAAEAHTLSISTTRVVLRDRHIEVQAEWDAFALVDATPTAVATMTDADLEAAHRRWLTRLSAESRLTVDDHGLPVRVAAAPTRDELRAAAAQLSAAGQDHGMLLRIRFDGPLLVGEPARVAWTSPPALGPVLVSFMQPAARLAAPGEQVAFAVLERRPSVALASGPTAADVATQIAPRSDPSVQVARRPDRWSQVAWVCAAGLAGAVLGAWSGRRRPPQSGGGT